MSIDLPLSPELQTEIKLVVDKAARFIRRERENFSQDKVELKSFNDLVSYVDREAEVILQSGLQALIPGSGFIGEESGDDHKDAAWRWIVDPLDGTTNFIHDLPAYCVSVALQYQAQTLMGVVHDVPRNEVFHATLGGGAWLGDKRISVSGNNGLNGALIGTGFPHVNSDILHDYLAVIHQLLQTSHGIRRIGAAALDLAYVACGRLDGFIELGLKAWDVAAGALIVQEAGGTVTDMQGGGNFLFGRQIVASTPMLQASLLQLVGTHMEKYIRS